MTTTTTGSDSSTKSYKCMYMIPKELYKSLNAVSSHSQSSLNPVSQQQHCEKDFKHPNILAHHIKSHVDGFKCNICNKVFIHQEELQKHLNQHAMLTSKKYEALEKRQTTTTTSANILNCPICKKPSKHKRNLARHIRSHGQNCLSFNVANSNWKTLQ